VADSRQRIYYTKAQITNGLKTGGGEWMYTDGTEYIGQYHKYATGEVFSLATFVQDKSRILIPFVDLKKLIEDNELDIDFAKNFEYDTMKPGYVPKSSIPNTHLLNINYNDIDSSFIYRYFAYKKNDGRLLELSSNDYNNIGSPTGLDEILWEAFKIKWKLKGPFNDILDSEGNIKEHGIIDANKRTVVLYSEKYPSIADYLTDFREFSQA
jgi:hypothetical protein